MRNYCLGMILLFLGFLVPLEAQTITIEQDKSIKKKLRKLVIDEYVVFLNQMGDSSYTVEQKKRLLKGFSEGLCIKDLNVNDDLFFENTYESKYVELNDYAHNLMTFDYAHFRINRSRMKVSSLYWADKKHKQIKAVVTFETRLRKRTNPGEKIIPDVYRKKDMYFKFDYNEEEESTSNYKIQQVSSYTPNLDLVLKKNWKYKVEVLDNAEKDLMVTTVSFSPKKQSYKRGAKISVKWICYGNTLVPIRLSLTRDNEHVMDIKNPLNAKHKIHSWKIPKKTNTLSSGKGYRIKFEYEGKGGKTITRYSEPFVIKGRRKPYLWMVFGSIAGGGYWIYNKYILGSDLPEPPGRQ